jgi:isopenicillin N synthase-like dioxygenase
MDVPQGEPVAALKSVNFDKLLSGDSRSVQDLVQAAEVTGFFYLDLRGLKSRDLIREAQLLLDFSPRYFLQSKEIKSRHSRPGVERG